ncbi:MAG: 23S rRNA (adenine(2503)-C(2))-methyltransferase RlmN [Erysipelotrichaceae bacterium]
MKNIYDFTLNQLIDELTLYNEKKFRAKQIYQWLYHKRVQDFSLMSDLKKTFIDVLNQNYHLAGLKIKSKQIAKDGTVKFLFELTDGALIETVLMRFEYGNSLCISSQVGCNMGCKFCASGLLKKQRDLTSGEMVAQVMEAIIHLDQDEERLSNIVIMGTGEPFDNYQNVMDFCAIVNDSLGLAIGARHITISTCGLAPKIREFANEHTQYNLAISLHAANDELRGRIMPINHAYDLNELVEALRYYQQHSNRKITLEYILLKDVNDSNQDAIDLAKICNKLNAYVNLIPYNAVDEHGFQGSDHKRVLGFYDCLMKNKAKATIRNRVGDDIDAACGQLRAKYEGKA